MNEISVVNPLYENDLECAAWLCMEEAAMTDLDRFPQGSGRLSCQGLHKRGERFKEALVKMKRDASCSILDLGLSPEDCSWAANQARRAVDGPGWQYRFRTAEMRLQMALLQKSSA
jgi:hypothetical protein